MKHEAYETYVELNMGYAPAFIYRVHPEGFYSQVNMILIAAAFSLMHRRRLMVDTRNIIGKWDEYFGVSLPGGNTAMSWATDFLPRRYEWLKYHGGLMLLQWADKIHNDNDLVKIPDLGFEGSIFEYFRLLAKMLCPHAKPKQPIIAGDYIACHVRRGDKLIQEGEFHDVSVYLDAIKNTADSTKTIFVMTDDYGVIEDFRAQAPGFEFVTMCRPHQRGYVNAAFLRQGRAQSKRELIILQQEVAIACESQVFIGCYLSNVSRFVALTHEHPEQCMSIDAQGCWIPGAPQYQKPNDEP